MNEGRMVVYLIAVAAAGSSNAHQTAPREIIM
jgi:hypothetical protein